MPKKFVEIYRQILREEGYTDQVIALIERRLVNLFPAMRATLDELIPDDKFQQILQLNRKLKVDADKRCDANPSGALDSAIKDTLANSKHN